MRLEIGTKNPKVFYKPLSTVLITSIKLGSKYPNGHTRDEEWNYNTVRSVPYSMGWRNMFLTCKFQLTVRWNESKLSQEPKKFLHLSVKNIPWASTLHTGTHKRISSYTSEVHKNPRLKLQPRLSAV